MVAKCILQEIWKLGLDWDSEIPDGLKRSFERWLRGLNVLSTWKVPRSYTGLGWSAADSVELHAFGDASGKGYGACTYVKLTYPDGVSKTALVMSKARVAPVKRVTLPRLELLGALLCVRLLQFVHQSLKLSAETRSWCWTDSMVVLNWIQGSADRWKPFVQNRVLEIQSLSSPGQWRHCPGIDNPADLVSRGMFAEDLIQSDLWLSGPSFLLESDHMVMQTSQVMSCAAGPTSDVLAEPHRNLSCQHVLPNLLLQILWDPREISPLCCLTLSVGGHSREPYVLWRGVCYSYTMWNLLLLMTADWLVILPTMSWPRLRPVCSRMIREGTSVRNWLFWAGMNQFLLLHPLPVWVHTWGQMG